MRMVLMPQLEMTPVLHTEIFKAFQTPSSAKACKDNKQSFPGVCAVFFASRRVALSRGPFFRANCAHWEAAVANAK
eukprot:3978325-Amphidinium_carterae.1